MHERWCFSFWHRHWHDLWCDVCWRCARQRHRACWEILFDGVDHLAPPPQACCTTQGTRGHQGHPCSKLIPSMNDTFSAAVSGSLDICCNSLLISAGVIFEPRHWCLKRSILLLTQNLLALKRSSGFGHATKHCRSGSESGAVTRAWLTPPKGWTFTFALLSKSFTNSHIIDGNAHNLTSPPSTRCVDTHTHTHPVRKQRSTSPGSHRCTLLKPAAT